MEIYVVGEYIDDIDYEGTHMHKYFSTKLKAIQYKKAFLNKAPDGKYANKCTDPDGYLTGYIFIDKILKISYIAFFIA